VRCTVREPRPGCLCVRKQSTGQVAPRKPPPLCVCGCLRRMHTSTQSQHCEHLYLPRHLTRSNLPTRYTPWYWTKWNHNKNDLYTCTGAGHKSYSNKCTVIVCIWANACAQWRRVQSGRRACMYIRQCQGCGRLLLFLRTTRVQITKSLHVCICLQLYADVGRIRVYSARGQGVVYPFLYYPPPRTHRRKRTRV
jgi:hypothetical protein